MAQNRMGQRVRVTGGMREFVGCCGAVVGCEKYGRGSPMLYRVRFDEPVWVDGVGAVRDDLWEDKLLQRVR